MEHLGWINPRYYLFEVHEPPPWRGRGTEGGLKPFLTIRKGWDGWEPYDKVGWEPQPRGWNDEILKCRLIRILRKAIQKEKRGKNSRLHPRFYIVSIRVGSNIRCKVSDNQCLKQIKRSFCFFNFLSETEIERPKTLCSWLLSDGASIGA